MWPVAVVPSEVEGQFLLEDCMAVRDQDQPSRALGFHRPYTPFNNRQAPVLSQSAESMPNPVATTPPSERSRGELNALVRDEIVRDGSRLLKGSFEESLY
jgi:hypothetical protein